MSDPSSYYNINWLKNDGTVVSSGGTIQGDQFITDVNCPYYPGDDDLGIAISKDLADEKLIKLDASSQFMHYLEKDKPVPQTIIHIKKSFINIDLSGWFKKITQVTNNSNLPEETKASLLSSYNTLQNSKEPNKFIKGLNISGSVIHPLSFSSNILA